MYRVHVYEQKHVSNVEQRLILLQCKYLQCVPLMLLHLVNSLWPSDTIWRQRSGSNIGSGNGLLPDGTKPLPETILTHHQ